MASAAWERRNAAARAKGFKNYYEYRTRKTPGAPKPSRDELRRRRGHAGRSDLDRALKGGRVELISVVQTRWEPPTFELVCTMKDGSQRTFFVKGEPEVRRFRDRLDSLGADRPEIVGSPRGLHKLLEDEELEAEIAAAEAEAELGEPDAGAEPYTYDDSDIPF